MWAGKARRVTVGECPSVRILGRGPPRGNGCLRWAVAVVGPVRDPGVRPGTSRRCSRGGLAEGPRRLGHWPVFAM